MVVVVQQYLSELLLATSLVRRLVEICVDKLVKQRGVAGRQVGCGAVLGLGKDWGGGVLREGWVGGVL